MNSPAKNLPRPPRFVEFGEFSFDADAKILWRAGESVTLAPKACELLGVLIENAPRVLSKEDLMNQVWADSFVEEANITHHISVLRKVLGEDKNGKKFIETFPRKGYRFAAEVKEANGGAAATEIIVSERVVKLVNTEIKIDSDDETDESARQTAMAATPKIAPETIAPPLFPAAQSFSRRRRIGALAILAIILTTGAIFAARQFWGTSPPAFFDDATRPKWRVAAVLETKNAAFGDVMNVSFAPDGKFLAFHRVVGEGKTAIFVKQIGGGEPVRLTDGKWLDTNAVWLADGARIAFVSNRDNFRGVWTIPVLGGTPALLKQLDVPPDNRESLRLLKISAGGDRLFYQFGNRLFAVGTSEEKSVWVSEFLGGRFEQTNFFAVAPDDAQMAFAATVNGESQIFTVPINGGEEPRQMTTGGGEKRHPAWFDDGRHLAYASDETGKFQVYAADAAGGAARQLTLSDAHNTEPIVSADGRAILFHTRRDEANVYSIAPDENAAETAHTSNTILQIFPAASADNARIAFQTATSGAKLFEGVIKVLPLDGASQAFDVAPKGYSPQWSPAGDWLAFVREENGTHDLWRVSANGQNETRLTNIGVISSGYAVAPFNFDHRIFVFSPDGSQIAFQSKNGGFPNLWTMATDGSGTVKKWTANAGEAVGMTSWFWSPDGKRLAFVMYQKKAETSEKPVFVVGASDDKTTKKIVELNHLSHILGWSADGRDVFVAERETVRTESDKKILVTLYRVSADGGTRKVIARLETVNSDNIHLSPDARQIVFAAQSAEEKTENLYSIATEENAAPRRLTGNREPSVFYSGAAFAPDGKRIYFSKQTGGDSYSLLNISN